MIVSDKKIGLMKDLISEGSINIPKVGDIVDAKIIEVKPHMAFIDLENFKTAIIPGREIKQNPQEFKKVSKGDTISVKITNSENEEGYVEASLLKAGEEKSWQKLEEKMENKETIEAKVTKANKGGLMVSVEGIEAFMPVSQLSSKHYPRVEGGDKQKILQALNELINKTIKLKIINLDPRLKKLIVSERITEEKKLKKALEKYKIGDIIEGEI